MNEREQVELEILKRRQEALQMQLAKLTVDIQQLASRLNAVTQPVAEVRPEEIKPAEMPPLRMHEEPVPPPAPPAPPPLPPVIATAIAQSLGTPLTETVSELTPLPVPIASSASEQAEVPKVNIQVHRDGTIERLAEAPPILTESPVTGPPPASASVPVSEPPPPRETFEMKLGTYWLVRIGIVMLLTGLVFLGTYAYKNYIVKSGPAEKLALLYAASAALLGFGGWLQRKREKESLRNYGQVLFAGGLAAVYFTTYAAHYVDVLRVIASPVIDALLLLGWAAITIWIADRRKSEVLALFAVGLAYYTSAITQVGLFTLGSNLVLTAAAVFFLVRNRWTTLSFISVLATYGGFAFWRFHRGDWSWDAQVEDVWHANFFLAGYWLFFTAAVFFSRGSKLVNANRSLFASLNNGAFFGLVILSMMHISHGHFWIFSLVFGSVLLGAALFARTVLSVEPLVKNTYLVQGLVLITLGFIAHFVGLKLALILAAESVVLTILGGQQKNVFVRAGGFLTAALSVLWLLSITAWSRNETWIGSAIGVAFLVNAWWENHHDSGRGQAMLRPFSGYFVALAVGVCGIVTWHAAPEEWRAVAWMIEAVALTLLFYALRIPELPVLSQALALTAQAYWLLQLALRQEQPHWMLPATFIAAVLALTFLGHQQKSAAVRASAYLTAMTALLWSLSRMSGSHPDTTLGAIMGAAFLLSAWWEQRHDEQRAISVVRPFSGYFVALAIVVCGVVTWRVVPESWRAVAWMIEAIALTALFYAVRIPELPIFSQALAVAAQGFWFFEFALRENKPHWLVPATLVGGTLALSHWWQKQSRLALMTDVRNILQIVYALALVGVLFFWFKPNYGPAAWLSFLCLLAIGLTTYGVMTRSWALAACAQLFLLISSFELCQQFLATKPAWQHALAPIATWLILGVVTTAWLSRHGTRDEVRRPLLQVSTFYRGVAFLMSLWWIYAYVPAPNYFWVLCALGVALVTLAGWLKNSEALIFSGLFVVVAYSAWFTKIIVDDTAVIWPNALALASILAMQQVVRRLPQRFQLPQHVDIAAILVTGLATWTFVSRWIVRISGEHFLLTVSWAALAALFFAFGFILRERVYRWFGLGILACAIGRVFLSDVWKLDTIYRILSFMALGVVLLALGFVYNKYQEKIRQWL